MISIYEKIALCTKEKKDRAIPNKKGPFPKAYML